MASTSASAVPRSFTHEVFLSFRGEDTRSTFLDHLCDALVRRNVKTYKDEDKIEKGEKISDQLIRSIEESRFHIIVFSMNYASSSWCLQELVKIMECQKTKEQTAYPVFYHVDPTDIRNQSGAFGKAFEKHAGKEDAGKWRVALKEAADLVGWHVLDTPDVREAKVIQNLVREISLKLYLIDQIYIDKKLVGMETQIKKVNEYLEIDRIDDVRMIGIKGIGGGGKTTLARAVYDHISIDFDCQNFVENIKGKSLHLENLQEQILSTVLNDDKIVVRGVLDGKVMMRKMMGGRKVLIVLDDVDHIDQLDALAGELTWFKPGSRIIITTRDEQLLWAHNVTFIHDINLLSPDEATCLLSRYAFRREVPDQGYEELSRKVVEYAAGLPLAIRVLGSSLTGKTKSDWEGFIQRLKKVMSKGILEKLELSYDSLESDQQNIFLDIACILKGEQREEAIIILESCGWCAARHGLKVLEQRSLITISDTDRLYLHDLIEEMGKDIVRRVEPNEPNRHSRLWVKEEIEDILDNELGTQATRSIKLENPNLHPVTIMKGLRKMSRLICLYLDDRNQIRDQNEGVRYLPNSLRLLHWRGYPFLFLPSTFKANMLVNLEMPWSNISQLWEGNEVKVPSMLKLRFLDLKFSKLKTFDLGLTPELERLDLRECKDFEELHIPVEGLKLKFLNLSGSKLKTFDLGWTLELERLELRECKDFVELYMPVECFKLKFLNLSGSKISSLNLGMTPHLERLDLNQCDCLQEVQAPVGCLKKLVFLNISGCSRFVDFQVNSRYDQSPSGDSFANLQLIAMSLDKCPLHPNNNLPKFQFKCFYDEPLPSSSGNLEKLLSFGLCACTNLESFSASICGLRHLRELALEGSIREVPKDLWRLESLEKLSLWTKEIKHLPDSICHLEHLKSLKLKSCWLLEQLPKELGNLQCLQELHLMDCISLQDIPSSICEIKCLEYLHLPYCSLVEKLPEEIGNIKSLKELTIEGAGISSLPQSIKQIKGLCIIWSSVLLELHKFTSLKNISKYTASCHISCE